ncbi:MAG: glycosyltransferase [Candidatus Aenigmarchaeota archaeon]|nr:glycosyltransferase [Candidatus Aenigmarchaeota archaeon]
MNKEEYHAIASCPGQGRFVEELRKIGVEIKIIPYHRRILDVSRNENGVHLFTLPLFSWWLMPTILALRKLIKDRGVHLVVTNGIKCHFIGSVLSLITKVRLIWHVRDIIETGWLKWILRSLGRHFPDKIIVNSRAVGNIFSGNGKKETIYNGIDISRFDLETDREEIRSMLNVDKNTKLIGTVGHLAPLKGFEELIQAMAEVIKGGFDTKLAIVGDTIYSSSDGYKQKLLALVYSLGLKDRVVFTGFGENIPEFLASFDIFVLPSRSEGFGRSNLEAMAMGKPVVSTNVGGIPEVVLDGITGILVPPRNSHELARATIRLLNDSELRESLGREGRRRVEDHFTLQAYAQRIQEIYGEILQIE